MVKHFGYITVWAESVHRSKYIETSVFDGEEVKTAEYEKTESNQIKVILIGDSADNKLSHVRKMYSESSINADTKSKLYVC